MSVTIYVLVTNGKTFLTWFITSQCVLAVARALSSVSIPFYLLKHFQLLTRVLQTSLSYHYHALLSSFQWYLIVVFSFNPSFEAKMAQPGRPSLLKLAPLSPDKCLTPVNQLHHNTESPPARVWVPCLCRLYRWRHLPATGCGCWLGNQWSVIRVDALWLYSCCTVALAVPGRCPPHSHPLAPWNLASTGSTLVHKTLETFEKISSYNNLPCLWI